MAPPRNDLRTVGIEPLVDEFRDHPHAFPVVEIRLGEKSTTRPCGSVTQVVMRGALAQGAVPRGGKPTPVHIALWEGRDVLGDDHRGIGQMPFHHVPAGRQQHRRRDF